jgi:hypothetical protein
VPLVEEVLKTELGRAATLHLLMVDWLVQDQAPIAPHVTLKRAPQQGVSSF